MLEELLLFVPLREYVLAFQEFRVVVRGALFFELLIFLLCTLAGKNVRRRFKCNVLVILR